MASSTEQITVDGVAYDYQYIPDTKIRTKSKLVAVSRVIWSYLRSLATTLHNTYLAQLWPNSGYLLIGGIRYNTIEGIIGALAANGADTPVMNSTKFLTAGGAYADKSDMPVSGSSKTFTSGGAYADKAYVPEANSTKNFTAGGAYADKADAPAEGDTRCLTSGGAYANKTSAPAQGSKKGFQVSGIRAFTDWSPNARSWLGKLYGVMLGRHWLVHSTLNGVVINAFCYSPAWDLYMVAGAGADGDHKGVWWSTTGGFTKGTGSNMQGTIEAIACTGAVDGYEVTPMAVAATWSAGLIYSTDGKDWRYAESNSSHFFKFNTVYCKESVSDGVISVLWIAGSDAHGIWWSEDGKNWTQVAGTDGHTVNHIIGTRRFRHRDWVVVACTDSGVLVSTDGKNWTDANITSGLVNSNFNAKKAVYANFADAVGNDVSMVTVIGTHKSTGEGLILRSTDSYCTSWTYASTSQNYEPMDVAAGWGKVVVALRNKNGGTSSLQVANVYRASITDAVTYNTRDIPDNYLPNSIFYANGIWVCACASPSGNASSAMSYISVDNCKTMNTGIQWADNAFKRVWYAAGRWFLTTSTGVTRASEVKYLNFND